MANKIRFSEKENNSTISKDIAEKILMIGVYYKHHATGGIAAVVQYYNKYFDELRYVSTMRKGNKIGKFYDAVIAYFTVLFLLIFDKRIKILHIHTSADLSFYRKMLFVNLSKLFNKKIVIHIHASRFKDFYKKSKNKKCIIDTLNKADIVITLSKSWEKWFQSIGIPDEKIVVLNNIVDYPTEQNILKEEKVKLLFLGEIGERKGVFDVLQVLAENKSFYKNKIIFRIGGNKLEDELNAFIHDNGLSDFVKFEGWVSGDKKIELLNWADVFILPSFNEGLPIAVLEAMSYGCAIISTPVGGILEVLHDYKNGIVVTPGIHEEIHHAISYVINNPVKIHSFGVKSKEIVASFYPSSVLVNLKEIYNNLIN
jgi:glycosyltransferase involved in cell wall biosynthesis